MLFSQDVDIGVSPATAQDVDAIRTLLIESELPTAGVDDHWKTFLVGRDEEKMVACGGAEIYPAAALIRSIAVRSDYRNSGVGRRLVRHLLDHLSAIGIREFYLLTTTAEEYFAKRGFKTIGRTEVHPQLLASREFQDACPQMAICMRLVMLG